jgi:hypothetical protein
VYEKTRFSNCSLCDFYGYISDHHKFPLSEQEFCKKMNIEKRGKTK